MYRASWQIVAPLAVGLIFGPAALGGMLGGALSAGVLLAIMMANAGGAWDNAKKYIEEGYFGGKGQRAAQRQLSLAIPSVTRSRILPVRPSTF